MHRLICCVIILCAFDLHGEGAMPADEPAKSAADAQTLTGKVMCGYQGWFNGEGDGANLGWKHWARQRMKPFAPGNVTVDLWPDMSEYTAEEKFTTGFQHADGSHAEVFSSVHPETVRRHFRWMREHGIDGAFIQRFANGLAHDAERRHTDAVLQSVRSASQLSGTVYAVMYDLSGLKAGGVAGVGEDWRNLRTEWNLTTDRSYLHHEGKPVVAVWGVGFNDDRDYTLAECHQLITRLKSDGCTVMLGVPTGWRDGSRDAARDPRLQEVLALADVLSPWTIGRYRTPDEAARHGERVWKPDLEWCRERRIDFLPVVYPGFSWHNLHGGPLDDIPRLKGQFLWSQVAAAKRAGAQMLYVAMFDEVDEGTAIFKCTNQPPTANGAQFLTYEGLPPDFYLHLTGQAGRLIRDEIPLSDSLPTP